MFLPAIGHSVNLFFLYRGHPQVGAINPQGENEHSWILIHNPRSLLINHNPCNPQVPKPHPQESQPANIHPPSSCSTQGAVRPLDRKGKEYSPLFIHAVHRAAPVPFQCSRVRPTRKSSCFGLQGTHCRPGYQAPIPPGIMK